MAYRLEVSRALKYPGQVYDFEADLEGSEYEITGDTVTLNDVKMSGEYFSGGEKISLKGRVTSRVGATCDRCLKSMEMMVEADVDILFATDPGDDPDIYPLEGRFVELDDPAKDALLLELPMRFLCSETCKGLCPKCGHDLNEGPCTCQEGDTESLSGIHYEGQIFEEV